MTCTHPRMEPGLQLYCPDCGYSSAPMVSTTYTPQPRWAKPKLAPASETPDLLNWEGDDDA